MIVTRSDYIVYDGVVQIYLNLHIVLNNKNLSTNLKQFAAKSRAMQWLLGTDKST